MIMIVAERSFLDGLIEDEFLYANQHVTHGWRLQTSRLRISGSKIGRNIEGRYKTGLKPETKVGKAGNKSTKQAADQRCTRRLASNAKKSALAAAE